MCEEIPPCAPWGMDREEEGARDRHRCSQDETLPTGWGGEKIRDVEPLFDM